MIDFFIKSTLCLGILLTVYSLFLEKEKMHVFNRFFLLFSLVFSLALPFIRIELTSKTNSIFNGKILPEMLINNNVVSDSTPYFSIISWTIYAIATLSIVFKFVRNLLEISFKIRNNQTEIFHNSKLVLLEEKVLPHTFLNYIFINKDDYNNRKIEAELFAHELTHVRQKHSFDILIIEILKTIFWFNPIFIFYKKAIQLNHEFLADEKVVKSYNNVPFYQSLLIEKASENKTIYLTSNLNYLVTKKRLIMMTKNTPMAKALFKKVALMPLFAGIIFFSCIKSIAQETPKADELNTQEKIYNTAELTQKPEFIGGINEFYTFVAKNFKMPKQAIDTNLKGKAFVKFIVEKDGSITNVELIRGIGFGTDEEVVRVLKASPKWNPGKMDDSPVRVRYSLPITMQTSK